LLFRQALDGRPISLIHAASVAAARETLRQQTVDLVVLADDLPNGGGLELAKELSDGRTRIQTIIVTDKTESSCAISALRAGAADLLVRPLSLPEVGERVICAMSRHRLLQRDRTRLTRLRRVCKKLNRAREEISQQVDILCQDLVSAYQELATQMQQVAQTSDYASLMRQELDLEQLLRKTLEYLLEKVGPTNAAIFLPANIDEFSLGGYVNYDWTAQSPDMLLQHLADVVTPKIAELDTALHLTDAAALHELIGEDSIYLDGCHFVATPCRADGEILGVMMLFRDESEPFDPQALEICDSIGPMLAQYLARIIRIHHRHLPDLVDDGDDENALPL